MRHTSLLIVLCWCTLLNFAHGQDAENPIEAALGQNAAIQYWQAFEFLPSLSDEQRKQLEDWHTGPLDEADKELINLSQKSVMYLRRGAQMQQCNWGLDFNDGISMLMPHLAPARDLARFAALHARHEFENGNSKQAGQTARAILVLARHTGGDPIMISMLVGYLIEDVTVDVVAPYLPEVSASYADALAQFNELPRAAKLSEALVAEKRFMGQWAIRKLQDEEQRKPGAGIALWKTFLGGSEASEKLKKIDSLDQVLSMLEDMLPLYDELADIVKLEGEEFTSAYAAFKERNKSNDLAALFLPEIERIRSRGQACEARLAMMLAAIAVIEGGEEKLKEIRDPFGDGPFEYRKLDQGFELRSKLMFEGQPVMVTFGQPKK